MNTIDIEFVNKVESQYFRTNKDTGTNPNTLLVWNCVRKHVGLPILERACLPAYCTAHNTYHVIRCGYGCVREDGTKDGIT